MAFVLRVALVYASWRTLKYLGENYNFLWGGWHAFYDFIGNILASSVSWLLTMLSVPHERVARTITVQGTGGIYFADLCLGIAPLYIYAGIILSIGNNWKARLWFIPLGWVGIYVINVFRMAALILIHAYAYQYFRFAHEYLYVVITYGLIFLMMVWWMNRWAFEPKSS